MKTLKITICIILCVFLTACAWDGGRRIVGVAIYTHPDQLVYVIGIDRELNLEGGKILFLTRDNRNRPELWERATAPILRYERRILHDINFREEGLYRVEFIWPHDFTTFFYVQVISIETLKYRVGLL